MELRQLTALVTVAEVGSVTKAAKLLHVVQPAVTRQIRLLEEELGVPLFQRTRHGMVPTPAAEVLIMRARRALRELDAARAELRPEPGEVAGIVSVGLLESVLDILAQPLTDAVARRHPGIELRLFTGYSGHLQQWLDTGEVDLSLLYNLSDTPSLSVVPLVREQLWAVAPPDAGLSADSPVAWATVLAQPLVLPVTGHGLRALIDRARSAVPMEPRTVVQTNSMLLQKKLVLAGHGWTVLPAAGVAADVAAGQLSGAPLTAPDVERSVVLGLQHRSRMLAPVEAVASTLTRLVGELVRSGAWPAATADARPKPAAG
ncbi:LysR family transcriptional regulator [Pseudonocardia sp. DSM 110487]|uniref:LysR family transcriptional regulator n=1 Tax=Pseudonocardia sp. DSM 110487 TaxID=2865833 RepID=UPI001C6A7A29|nr:LysR family transcriptional regulator [Pseudonocardia sp. DSM 110487]QYN39326.1 LysR family transcriptional regulator [Pseudonocardia sp. DSM 110487]